MGSSDLGMDLKGSDAVPQSAGTVGTPVALGKRFVGVSPRLMSTHPYSKSVWDTVEWSERHVEIKKSDGTLAYSGNGQFPETWSQNACALVAEKYFRHVIHDAVDVKLGDVPKVRETSVRQMVDRVSSTIARWGRDLGYFKDEDSNGHKATYEVFRDELAYILLHQMAAFNSPVWFNVGTNAGIKRTEQCSACFINSLEDNMSSILELKSTEGRLYKGGSGSGVNYSKLRSSRESLSGGGYASGPVPFLAADDSNAGAIKSGGTTRRAAKMAMLDINHGDILEFIKCKANSELAAHALIDAGFDGDFRARWGAYQLVPFQNANHSVRVTDEFMQQVKEGGKWDLLARDGSVLEQVDAQKLWQEICKAAYICGDPGMQFDTTINKWHTSPKNGRINSSNPCSEYMYLDDTACNLASLNLMKFLNVDNTFDVTTFEHVTDIMTTAMDIIVDGAGYPTKLMQENSTKYRTLGIGYSNLGAYLMAQGLAYDSNEGRAQAAFITAILSGRAYSRSAEIAGCMGTFTTYEENLGDMMGVMRMHQSAVDRVSSNADTWFNGGARPGTYKLKDAATASWARCVQMGQRYGYRNAQISVLAPAGTISFLMDCDTTGIEPDLSLVKYKKLVGGGTMKIVNQQVPRALKSLGYSDPVAIENMCHYIVANGTLVGAGGILPNHLPVFDTALEEPREGRHIRPEAHILMMAAAQPFVSGAISKTVNLPNSATEEDIGRLYYLSWEKGLKAVALYRDGCKRTQPLSGKEKAPVEALAPAPLMLRKKLPPDITAKRHKFSIGQHKGYIHVGLYDDGSPGEVFMKMAKQGSTLAGLMDGVGILTSIALQYGVPLEVLVDKFSWSQFEPSGMTDNPDVKFAKSPLDYLFRWLGSRFGEKQEALDEDETPQPVVVENTPTPRHQGMQKVFKAHYGAKATGLICSNCGNPAQRAGSCISCSTCGATSGCG